MNVTAGVGRSQILEGELDQRENRPALVTPFSENIEEQREHHAEQDRGREWEVKRCVLATVDDVPGEAAEWDVRAAEKNQEHARNEQDRSEQDQKLTEITHSPRWHEFFQLLRREAIQGGTILCNVKYLTSVRPAR